jgi:hypothetical protein
VVILAVARAQTVRRGRLAATFFKKNGICRRGECDVAAAGTPGEMFAHYSGA